MHSSGSGRYIIKIINILLLVVLSQSAPHKDVCVLHVRKGHLHASCSTQNLYSMLCDLGFGSLLKILNSTPRLVRDASALRGVYILYIASACLYLVHL